MIKMSFHNGTLDKEKAKNEIRESKKPLFKREGFSYRGARKVLVNKSDAIDIINNTTLLDIDEDEKEIVLNNEWTMYVVEDVSGASVDKYHYEINFLPQEIIPVTFTSKS